MDGYLGTTILESYVGTPYENFTPKDWALVYIGSYGGIDGGHHKMWVLDQVARILNGTSVILSLAKWSNGHQEYRFSTADDPSQEYLDWVTEMKGDYDEENEEYEYDWDEGCVP